MIQGFRHKGLERFFRKGETKGLDQKLLKHLRVLLFAMDVAKSLQSLDFPGLRLHPLKGDRKGQWSVSVSGNWRIVFIFDGKDCRDVDLVDYH